MRTESLSVPIRPPLWRALARDRARVVRDVHYALDLRISAMARNVHAHQRIELELTSLPRDALWLDWRPRDAAQSWKYSAPTLRVNEQNAGDRGTGLVGGFLRIPSALLALGRNRLMIDWTAPILRSGGALTSYRDPDDGARYVYSLFVPMEASSVFPCIDQPDVKARFSLTLDTPAEWRVATNAPLIACRRQGRSRISRFAPTEPISTYAFAFAAGPFLALRAATIDTRTKLWVRRSQRRRAQAQRDAILGLNEHAAHAFCRYFGHAFPFAKYDLVLIPELPYRGMEHAGATFLNEQAALIDDTASEQQSFERAQLIFHETAHQWLGDLVTMRSFDDLWIKEGFANFIAYKLAAGSGFRAEAEVGFHLLKCSAYETDQGGGTRALHQGLPNGAAAKLAYGSIVYGKAPAVLRQWEAWLGAQRFRAGVRVLVARHAYGPADWRDVVAALAHAARAPIDDWARPWLLRRGVPVIEIRTVTASGLRLMLSQRPQRSRTWPVRLVIASHTKASRADRHIVRVQGRPVSLRLSNRSAPETASLRIDPDDTAYALVRLQPHDLQRLARALPSIRRPLARIQIWQYLWQAVRDTRLAPHAFVGHVLTSLPRESQAAIVAAVLVKTGIAMDRLLAGRSDSTLASALDSLLWQRVQEASAKNVAQAWLEGCIALCRGASTCERLSELATGAFRLARLQVDDGVRMRAAASTIVRGGELDMRSFARSGQREVMSARTGLLLAAASPDAGTKRDVLQRLLDDPGLPDDWIVAALAYLHHPAHAPATAHLLTRALQAVPRLIEQRKIFFVDRWLRSTLGGQYSAAALNRARRFLERKHFDRDLECKVREPVDELARVVRIRRRWSIGT